MQSSDKRFDLENLMMSVIGHLVLAALMLTSVVVLVKQAQLIAPDRVQIYEIDLDAVKISGDETKLYNTGTPDSKQTSTVSEKRPESIVEQKAPDETKASDSHALVDDMHDKAKDKKNTDSKSKSTSDAPKKKTVVRVNRESVSLNRTLNVSVVDALRVAMTRCWVIDKNRPDINDIRAVAHLTMRKNGTVRDMWFESAARAETDPAFAYVLDTIRAAINTCQPLRMLPVGDFAKWEKIQLTFYPVSGKVM